MVSNILNLTLLGILSCLFGCRKDQAAPNSLATFSELSQNDIERLERQRGVIAAAIKDRYSTNTLTKTDADLPIIQALIDDHVFSKSQTYELQSLGVVFGDVLAARYPLRWMIVKDEFGTDPALRYKDTSVQINALTILSKRIEDDEEIGDVSAFADMIGETLVEMDKKGDAIR